MKLFRLFFISLAVLNLTGCLVTSVVGLAVDTVTTAGSIAVKTTGAVADVVVPEDDEEEKDED